jgi:hypothetical protein
MDVNWDLHRDGHEFLFIHHGGGAGVQLVWTLDWPELVAPRPARR